MSKTDLVQLTTYVPPEQIQKIIKRRGDKGHISWSDYLRVLIAEDLNRKD